MTTPWEHFLASKQAGSTPEARRHLSRLEGSEGGCFADGVMELAKRRAESQGRADFTYEDCLAVEDQIEKDAALKRETRLKPHQREAVEKVLANDGSLLVAHGMGTGKTPTSVAAVEALRERGKAHVTLAVTPAALRENMIHDGVHKFSDQAGVVLGAKGERGAVHIDHPQLPHASYYAVSNEMFRKDPMRYIKRTGADTVVWDEIHKGRDQASLNHAAMMAIRPHVRNFIGLTGTPISNHPRDILPVLDIVTNKRHGLGRNQKEFEDTFLHHVEKTHGPLGFLGIGPKSTETKLRNTEYLRHQLSKHVHHVSTDEVAGDMPKKKVIDRPVEMSQHQQRLYNFAMDKVDPVSRWKIRMNLPVGSREAQHIFARITQARQVSNSVHTLDAGHTAQTAAEATPKIKHLVDDVHKELTAAPHHKAIVYTNFVKGGVDAVAEGLRARGYEPAFFLGQKHQKRQDRAQHVDDYLKGHKRVMIINSAGTEGLNLPGTTSHHTLDPHFNPAVADQAEARGIRAGSPVKEVRVYRYKSTLPRRWAGFLGPDTSADEWVQGIADRKEHLNHQFTGLMRR